MDVTEMKNWCTSMLKPDNMLNKPSSEPTKMEGLLTKRDYFGIAFGAISITAAMFFLAGVGVLLKDAFADPEGFSNVMSILMILIGLGTYVYALKFKPDSRYWGEVGTYALVIFFTAGFISLGTTMEFWEKPKTGIFILLFLYIPVLYLRKNLLGGIAFAVLLMAYASEGWLGGLLGGSLRMVGARGVGSYLSGEASSFWFWFFFITYIPYFTLSFKENFKPGIESTILGYYFAMLLLFGVSSALGSHQVTGILLAASLLYLIGNIVYKHNYILFRPFQIISVIIFISAAYLMMNEGSMKGMYAMSGYMSFVGSILKEWTAYIVILVIAVAAFMVYMIWKSEYVDNDRKANVFAIALPFYFLLMAPLVNWGLESVVVILNILVIMLLAILVIHYSLSENKWYNLLWAPIMVVSGLLALGNHFDLGDKFTGFLMLVSAGVLGWLVFKFIPKVGETCLPGEDNADNATPAPEPTPSPAPAAEPKEEPKATEEPAAEENKED
jgi:hypothetical protein